MTPPATNDTNSRIHESTSSPLIECIPNFSEGNDTAVIRQITDAIEAVPEIKLLHIDQGKAANRTVVTFVGPPEAVTEAAYQAIKQAAEVIDMRKQQGEHPRIGATDVCPLVPLRNITMDEVVQHAKQLAKRVGETLHIPVYLYEYAASSKERVNLANIRRGEYESLEDKIRKPTWQPDFGPKKLNERTGGTVIGARDFLIAFNVNLNTTVTDKAKAIARAIRKERREEGKYEGLKAIGWYIDEYRSAQVSLNLTDIEATPLHTAYEVVKLKAKEQGLEVTGSEIIGLVPLKAMLKCGRYYTDQDDLSEQDYIQAAIASLQLNAVTPFHPEKKIIEYLI